jgi:histidinol-phosphate aminotransferase
MSVFWSSRARKLEPYIPGEQPRISGLIKLNSNENPYPPSPAVIEAIQAAAGSRLRLYPDPSSAGLREAVAEAYGVSVAETFVGNSSDEILAFVFAAFFESRAAAPVLFPDVTYSFYPVFAKLWDVPFETVRLNDDFSIEAGDYCHSSGGVIFPNPNAPTGRLLPLASVERIARAQAENNRVLVVDEAYSAFSAVSAVPLTAAHPNLLTVHTLSKAFSLAGLRVGYSIGSRPLIEALERVRDSFNSYTVDRLAQAGAAAAIRDRAYYAETARKIIATRERVSRALINRGFEVVPSAANFLFIRSPTVGGLELCARLREKGILVRHFNQERTRDYLRVSIGADADMDAFLAAV